MILRWMSLWESLRGCDPNSMKIVEIDQGNMDVLSGLAPEDIMENLSRTWYRGLVLKDDGDERIRAAFVYEFKNADRDDKGTEAEIVWAYGDGEEVYKPLLEAYKEQLSDQEAVRSFFEFPDDEEHEDICSCLSEEGFKTLKGESRDVYVTVSDLTGIRLSKKEPPFYIKSLGELSARQYRNGIVDCLFQDRKGILEDLAWISMDWFEPDISSCIVMDEKAKGFLLVHKTESGILTVELLFAFSIDATKDLVELIKYTVQAAVKKYPPETKVLLRRHNDLVRALVEKLFPGTRGEKAIQGERREGRQE